MEAALVSPKSYNFSNCSLDIKQLHYHSPFSIRIGQINMSKMPALYPPN